MKKQRNKAANRMAYLITSAVLISSGIISMPKLASARDNYPCGRPTTNSYGESVQYCPITQGNVPVVDANQRVVGYLNQGGRANYFYCQAQGATYRSGNLENNWWAFTEADNSRPNRRVFGWVNEIYFTGGNNNEPDAALRRC